MSQKVAPTTDLRDMLRPFVPMWARRLRAQLLTKMEDDSPRSAHEYLRGELERMRAEAETQRWFIVSASTELRYASWRNFALSQLCFGPPQATSTPPREIPAELMDAFTMNGAAFIEYNYADATYPANWPLVYTDYEIDVYLKQIAGERYFIYGMTDVWLWESLEKYPVKDLDVVHMGSLTPWYEATALHHGATSTTIDYNPIITMTDRIRTMTVHEWDAERPRFDVAWSISSFEHDGLGMYGDPLDPDGDLKAMQKMKQIVKEGGLLFLSIPIGRDKILFNNARVYGRVRLPRLIDGWEQLDTYGLQPEHLDGPGHIQPIIVLRNT